MGTLLATQKAKVMGKAMGSGTARVKPPEQV
jgi:hypothetical protein